MKYYIQNKKEGCISLPGGPPGGRGGWGGAPRGACTCTRKGAPLPRCTVLIRIIAHRFGACMILKQNSCGTTAELWSRDTRICARKSLINSSAEGVFCL
jgi:hypothetical protein